MPGSLPHFGWGGLPGTVSDVLGHHRIVVCFHFGTNETEWCQEDTIVLLQFKVRISWLRIVDRTAWNINIQKSFFYMKIDLFNALYLSVLYKQVAPLAKLYIYIYTYNIYYIHIIYIYIYIYIYNNIMCNITSVLNN